jgi:protein required for attachment to host cells
MMNLNSNGQHTWVVVADSSSCRIYEFAKSPQNMHLIKEICHPENLLKDSAYMSDKQGHFRRGSASGHGTFLANADPKKTKVNQFSKEIVSLLEHDRKLQAFQHLILVSPPHMNGLLRQHFSKHLKRQLDLNIGKSATHFKQDQLVNFICQHLALH